MFSFAISTVVHIPWPVSSDHIANAVEARFFLWKESQHTQLMLCNTDPAFFKIHTQFYT